jgi:hypothetical protein
MEQEPSDEFRCIKRHFFDGVILCPVFPGENNFSIFKRFDAVI